MSEENMKPEPVSEVPRSSSDAVNNLLRNLNALLAKKPTQPVVQNPCGCPTTPSPDKRGLIDCELQDLYAAIDSLHEEISILQEKLEPILAPASQPANIVAQPEPELPKMALHIRTCRVKVKACALDIQSMRNRLEI